MKGKIPMRMKLGLAIAALALFGATAAHAQLTLTLNAPTGTGNGPYTFTGTIGNTGGTDLAVDSTSLSLPVGSTSSDDLFNFLAANGPLTIPAGGSVSFPPGPPTDLFTVTFPAGSGPFDGFYQVFASAAGVSSPIVPFTVTPAAVPEPSSLALFMSLGVAGTGLAFRRLRRR
jgi:hypothetical protein